MHARRVSIEFHRGPPRFTWKFTPNRTLPLSKLRASSPLYGAFHSKVVVNSPDSRASPRQSPVVSVASDEAQMWIARTAPQTRSPSHRTSSTVDSTHNIEVWLASIARGISEWKSSSVSAAHLLSTATPSTVKKLIASNSPTDGICGSLAPAQASLEALIQKGVEDVVFCLLEHIQTTPDLNQREDVIQILRRWLRVWSGGDASSQSAAHGILSAMGRVVQHRWTTTTTHPSCAKQPIVINPLEGFAVEVCSLVDALPPQSIQDAVDHVYAATGAAASALDVVVFVVAHALSQQQQQLSMQYLFRRIRRFRLVEPLDISRQCFLLVMCAVEICRLGAQSEWIDELVPLLAAPWMWASRDGARLCHNALVHLMLTRSSNSSSGERPHWCASTLLPQWTRTMSNTFRPTVEQCSLLVIAVEQRRITSTSDVVLVETLALDTIARVIVGTGTKPVESLDSVASLEMMSHALSTIYTLSTESSFSQLCAKRLKDLVQQGNRKCGQLAEAIRSDPTKDLIKAPDSVLHFAIGTIGRIVSLVASHNGEEKVCDCDGFASLIGLLCAAAEVFSTRYQYGQLPVFDEAALSGFAFCFPRLALNGIQSKPTTMLSLERTAALRWMNRRGYLDRRKVVAALRDANVHHCMPLGDVLRWSAFAWLRGAPSGEVQKWIEATVHVASLHPSSSGEGSGLSPLDTYAALVDVYRGLQSLLCPKVTAAAPWEAALQLVAHVSEVSTPSWQLIQHALQCLSKGPSGLTTTPPTQSKDFAVWLVMNWNASKEQPVNVMQVQVTTSDSVTGLPKPLLESHKDGNTPRAPLAKGHWAAATYLLQLAASTNSTSSSGVRSLLDEYLEEVVWMQQRCSTSTSASVVTSVPPPLRQLIDMAASKCGVVVPEVGVPPGKPVDVVTMSLHDAVSNLVSMLKIPHGWISAAQSILSRPLQFQNGLPSNPAYRRVVNDVVRQAAQHQSWETAAQLLHHYRNYNTNDVTSTTRRPFIAISPSTVHSVFDVFANGGKWVESIQLCGWLSEERNTASKHLSPNRSWPTSLAALLMLRAVRKAGAWEASLKLFREFHRTSLAKKGDLQLTFAHVTEFASCLVHSAPLASLDIAVCALQAAANRGQPNESSLQSLIAFLHFASKGVGVGSEAAAGEDNGNTLDVFLSAMDTLVSRSKVGHPSRSAHEVATLKNVWVLSLAAFQRALARPPAEATVSLPRMSALQALLNVLRTQDRWEESLRVVDCSLKPWLEHCDGGSWMQNGAVASRLVYTCLATTYRAPTAWLASLQLYHVAHGAAARVDGALDSRLVDRAAHCVVLGSATEIRRWEVALALCAAAEREASQARPMRRHRRHSQQRHPSYVSSALIECVMEDAARRGDMGVAHRCVEHLLRVNVLPVAFTHGAAPRVMSVAEATVGHPGAATDALDILTRGIRGVEARIQSFHDAKYQSPVVVDDAVCLRLMLVHAAATLERIARRSSKNGKGDDTSQQVMARQSIQNLISALQKYHRQRSDEDSSARKLPRHVISALESAVVVLRDILNDDARACVIETWLSKGGV